MADIFISYSSQDRDQAEMLTELLASAGLSVWIDKQGIGAATSWSGEITKAISDCTALIVMLSPSSVKSKNVVREVALAFEKNKKILPLDLEPVTLTDDLAYHLAGIQRSSMMSIDAIIRALGKLGLEATKAPEIKLVKDADDGRKSLMVLPFEDLSPTGDNEWFTNGIVSELITALSNVKSLHVADQEATKGYKRYKGTLPVYAREMNIRYFVQGDVRKFGDNIKITARLLDIDTGDHLWQDSLKGTMEDIFDIQEAVAKKVTDGLNLILTSEEKKKLAVRGTENAEAYQLYLKAHEYFLRQTKEGYELAAKLDSDAIALDPEYSQAYVAKANALANLYRNYRRDPKLLEEGLALIREAKRLKPNLSRANAPLSLILTLQGKLEEAESAALEYIRNAPEDFLSHSALGFFYWQTRQPAKAIAPYEESLRLKPDDLGALFTLVLACHYAGETSKREQWALEAIPKTAKHLKLFPDDESWRVYYALLLHYACRDDAARAAARELENLRDGSSLYNTACLHCALKDYTAGLATFRKAIEAGLRDTRRLQSFLNDDDGGVASLKGTPEWEEAKALLEKIEREEEVKTNG